MVFLSSSNPCNLTCSYQLSHCFSLSIMTGMPPSNWVTFLNMPLTSHSVAITAGVCHVIAGLCQNSSHMRSELHDHGVCESEHYFPTRLCSLALCLTYGCALGLMILLSSRLALQYPSLAENVCSAVNSLVCKDTRNMAKFHELGVCQSENLNTHLS